MTCETQEFLRKVLIAILAIILAFAIKGFFDDFRTLYKSNELSKSYYSHVQRKQPEYPSEITSWMTFGYINFIFHLPSDYLKNQLSITDARYPNLQIGRYARRNHLINADFLNEVQNAVSTFRTF